MLPYLTFTTAKVKIKLPSYFFPNSHACPLYINKYPVLHFDPGLMEKYSAWKAAGGTELNWDTLNHDDLDFTTPVNTTQPLQSEVTNSPKET